MLLLLVNRKGACIVLVDWEKKRPKSVISNLLACPFGFLRTMMRKNGF